MSYRETFDAIGKVNMALQHAPVTMTLFNLRPLFHIQSFDPFQIGAFGRFYNRAPRLIGDYTLRLLLVAPDPRNQDLALIHGAVQLGNYDRGYGIPMQEETVLATARQVGVNLISDSSPNR